MLRSRIVAGAVALIALTAGCSSSETPTSSGSTGASAPVDVASIPYNGPEASLPRAFPVPAGKNLTVGFLSPSSVVPSLALTQQGIEDEVHKLGGTLIAKDAQVNVNTQVSQFGELIGQGVNAIIVFPLDERALAPQLQQAARAGIPCVAINAPFDATQPLEPGYAANVMQGFDEESYERAKYVASVSPGATYGLIGFGGAPVPNLRYRMERVQYWANRFGLKFAGESDAQTNDANGGAQAMTAILARAADVQYVFSFDDPSALGAAGAVRTAGKHVRVLGADASDQGTLDAVKAGVLFADYRSDQYVLGAQAVDATYAAAQRATLPFPQVVTSGKIVNKDTAASISPAGPLQQ